MRRQPGPPPAALSVYLRRTTVVAVGLTMVAAAGPAAATLCAPTGEKVGGG
ncbi:MAG: hypothetical protein QOG60_802, partial [Frankiaceae bacterium]|nr:hypothetical protein [Frankiaceae bacterium]